MEKNTQNVELTKLKALMEKLEGEDKCAVCQAIKALESTPTNSNNWTWMLPMFILLFNGWGSTNIDATAIMQAYLDTKDKMKEETTAEI